MGRRKRSPEHDYICARCLCACNPSGDKHISGGPNMKACGKPPVPMLRSEWDAQVKIEVAAAKDVLRAMTTKETTMNISEITKDLSSREILVQVIRAQESELVRDGVLDAEALAILIEMLVSDVGHRLGY